MRGMWRVKALVKRLRFVFGSVALLANWRELMQGVAQEDAGKYPVERPVLRFRNGMQLEMVSGGYGGYRYIFPDLFLDRVYCPTAHFVPRSGWQIVDLGANMGFFTCQASRAAPDVQVVAVEPIPAYAATLRSNVATNCSGGVVVVEGAVCGQSRKEMCLDVWYTAGGEVRSGNVTEAGAKTESVTVQAYTLLDIMEKGQFSSIDLLKCDIEGGEYELFQATPPEVWQRVRRVVMETHKLKGESESQLRGILKDNGFDVFSRGELTWARKPLDDRSVCE